MIIPAAIFLAGVGLMVWLATRTPTTCRECGHDYPTRRALNHHIAIAHND